MALRGLFLALILSFLSGLLADTIADVKVSNLRTSDEKNTYNVNANEGEYLTFELKADLKNLGNDDILTPSLPLTDNFELLAGFLKVDGSIGNTWPEAASSDSDITLKNGESKTIELKRRVMYKKSLCDDFLCLCVKATRVFKDKTYIAYKDQNTENDLACIKVTCNSAPATGVSDVQVSNLRTKTDGVKYNINADEGQNIKLEFKVNLKNHGTENIDSPKAPLNHNFDIRLGLLKLDGSIGNTWPKASSGDSSTTLYNKQSKTISLYRHITFKKSLCNSKVCACVKAERHFSSGKTHLAYTDLNTNNDLDCMDIVCEADNIQTDSDVKASNLRTVDNENEYEISADNGDKVTLNWKATLTNLGDGDVSSPTNPLSENFVFRVGILGLDGTIGNVWPEALSSDTDISLNNGQSKTVSFKRDITFSKSLCGDTICLCVKAMRKFVNGMTYIAYTDPDTSNNLACMKIKCSKTDGLTDVMASNLQRFNDDNEYVINANNGEIVSLDLKARLKNLGQGDIGSPQSPLTDNFVLQVGIVGLDGSSAGNWPKVSSNTKASLNEGQYKTFYMSRKIKFSKSLCGDKICLCVKSSRVFRNGKTYIAYNDPNTSNDAVCMNIVCDNGLSDVEAVDLRTFSSDFEYQVNANNGETVTLELKARLKNLGDKDIGHPKSPLTENFSFRVGLLGLDGTSANVWPEASSSEKDITLNNQQMREVKMTRKIKFSKSLCGDQICLCVKATRMFKNSKTYVAYIDPNTANNLACMKLVCDGENLVGVSDVEVSNLRTKNDDNVYKIDADNGDSITLNLKARLRNLGDSDIGSPQSPFSENFVFLVGILGFDGQIGNTWPKASSADTDISLNHGQSRTVYMTRKIKFSKSMCGDRICLCVKPKKVFSNGKNEVAYVDPNTGNDLACMLIECDSDSTPMADVRVNYLRTGSNRNDYEITANNGETLTLEFRAELDNLGPDDINSPQSPLNDNFVFRVGILGADGSIGNSWPKVSSSDTDISLNDGQRRVIRMSRKIKFSKSLCGDKICFCNKAARILKNSKTHIAYIDPNTANDLACMNIVCPQPNPLTNADVETSQLRTMNNEIVYGMSAENGDTITIELRARLRNLGPDDIDSPTSPFSDNFVFRVGIFGLDGTVGNSWPKVSSSDTDISLDRGESRTVTMTRKVKFSKSFCGDKICLCTKSTKLFIDGKNRAAYVDPNTENDLACMDISCELDPIIDVQSDVETSNLRMESGNQRFEIVNPENGQFINFNLRANLRNLGPDDIDFPTSPLTENFVFRLGILGFDGTIGNSWPRVDSPDSDMQLDVDQTRTVALLRKVKFSKSFCGDTICLCTKPSRQLQNSETFVSYIDPNTKNDLACIDIECKYDDSKDVYADVETSALRMHSKETKYFINANNGDSVTLNLIVNLKNLGRDNIPYPQSPLSDNFAFHVGLLGLDGSIGNAWPKVSSSESDITLNVGQTRTASLKRTIKFSKSYCGDKICVCTKAARVLKNSETFIAYIDPNTANDLACMDIECETSKVDVMISNLRVKETGKTTYEIVPDGSIVEVVADIANIGDQDIGYPKNPPSKNFFYRLYVFPLESNSKPKADEATLEGATLFAGTTRGVSITRYTVTLTQEDCKRKDLMICVSVKAVSEFDGSGNVISYNDYNPTNDMTCMPCKCTSSEITDDPHIIVWPDTTALKPLCFDLFGQSGDSYILLNDTAAGWSVSATLLDDFYFHKVIVKSPSNSVVVDTNGVRQTSMLFNGEEGALTIGDILMVYDKATKAITIQTGEYPDDLEVEIKLGSHAFGVKHLDVGIPDRRLTKHVGGILGHVKRNYQNVHEPVQSGQRVGVVVMNNRPFEALLTYRGNVKCWFVKTETALYPVKKEAFLIGQ